MKPKYEICMYTIEMMIIKQLWFLKKLFFHLSYRTSQMVSYFNSGDINIKWNKTLQTADSWLMWEVENPANEWIGKWEWNLENLDFVNILNICFIITISLWFYVLMRGYSQEAEWENKIKKIKFSRFGASVQEIFTLM